MRRAVAGAMWRRVLSTILNRRTLATPVHIRRRRGRDALQRVRAPSPPHRPTMCDSANAPTVSSASDRDSCACREAPTTRDTASSQQARRRGARAGGRRNGLGQIGKDDLTLGRQTRLDLGVVGSDHADLHRHPLLLTCLDNIDIRATTGRMHSRGRYHFDVLRLGQHHSDLGRRSCTDSVRACRQRHHKGVCVA